jgi:hypothetical protein
MMSVTAGWAAGRRVRPRGHARPPGGAAGGGQGCRGDHLVEDRLVPADVTAAQQRRVGDQRESGFDPQVADQVPAEQALVAVLGAPARQVGALSQVSCSGVGETEAGASGHLRAWWRSRSLPRHRGCGASGRADPHSLRLAAVDPPMTIWSQVARSSSMSNRVRNGLVTTIAWTYQGAHRAGVCCSRVSIRSLLSDRSSTVVVGSHERRFGDQNPVTGVAGWRLGRRRLGRRRWRPGGTSGAAPR